MLARWSHLPQAFAVQLAEERQRREEEQRSSRRSLARRLQSNLPFDELLSIRPDSHRNITTNASTTIS